MCQRTTDYLIYKMVSTFLGCMIPSTNPWRVFLCHGIHLDLQYDFSHVFSSSIFDAMNAMNVAWISYKNNWNYHIWYQYTIIDLWLWFDWIGRYWIDYIFWMYNNMIERIWQLEIRLQFPAICIFWYLPFLYLFFITLIFMPKSFCFIFWAWGCN